MTRPTTLIEDWLPFDAIADPLHSATITFPAIPSHPILRGIEWDDLRFWYRGHVVARTNYRKPPFGNFRPIVEAGGAEGLMWNPLLEMPYGKGRYILCQMLLLEKHDSAPAAAEILRNLLDYAATAPSPEWKRLRIAGDPSGNFKAFLDDNADDIAFCFQFKELSQFLHHYDCGLIDSELDLFFLFA